MLMWPHSLGFSHFLLFNEQLVGMNGIVQGPCGLVLSQAELVSAETISEQSRCHLSVVGGLR